MIKSCLFFLMGMISFTGLCFSQTSGNNETMTNNEQMSTKEPIVLIKTSVGDIKVQLNAEKAPLTVNNFLQYVKDGHYNHTIFHRVIDGFMIQGGGFTANLQQKPSRAPIPIESDNGLKNERGTLAMARTADPNSASSQFFINVIDNKFLDFRGKNPRDYGYTVFGKVIEGLDVVDKIKKVKTGNSGAYDDVPVEPVEIIEAKIVS